MSTPWVSFVARAIHGEADEPLLRLLRQRLAGGHQIVRINLERTPKGPIYVVLLSRLRELSKMEVPHSPSFTRWSLANGIRMASVEEETTRWAIVAADRFQAIADDFGADYANLIFVERARALAPPRTTHALAGVNAMRTAPGREQVRAIREVDAFLAGLATDLVGALGYSETEAAEILDGALERWRTGDEAVDPRAHRRFGEAARRGGRAGS